MTENFNPLIDGYSNDQLLAIGTRKVKLDVTMSATDINRSIPYDMSRAAMEQMNGHTEDELKDVGMRRANMPALFDSDTVGNRVDTNKIGAVDDIMNSLSKMFGIRTR
jgi:hypothetical protein